METLKIIEEFVAVNYSCGYGSGRGYGSGCGIGRGYGSGCGIGDNSFDNCDYNLGFSGVGFGHGIGDGSGSGSGSGYGDSTGYCYGYSGIKSFCGCPVYLIDGVQTIIDRIRGNVGRGRLLCDDLTTKDCFIVKQGNMFAHGETLHKAMRALQDKLFDDMPEEERIAEFIKCHDLKSEYSARDLWEWHHRLTGSCEMGRNQFAEEHAIDINATKLTVKEFIELTRHAYGGSVIRNLEKAYEAVINDD